VEEAGEGGLAGVVGKHREITGDVGGMMVGRRW